ncbi:tetratricopeptide repeat protein [Almyronema epifaneia]|uniref:Tetratricopeptide repeat protein n=1 Tax=Almyronema epifaneia S1 TaxID=2991925 RepID=A0ABW6IGD2_9CYAN
MQKVVKQLEDAHLTDRDSFLPLRHRRSPSRTNPFRDKTFKEVYDLYQEKIWTLKTKGRDGEKSVSKEQIESVVRLTELGSKAIAPTIISALGMPELIPVASSIATKMGQTMPQIASDLLTLKDGLLNKHADIEDEKTRNLLLMPLVYMTPLFIHFLIVASKHRNIVLVLKKYEKTSSMGETSSALNDWLCQHLLSSDSDLLKKAHGVRIVISSQNQLTQQECWANLCHYRDDAFTELRLEPFSPKEAREYFEAYFKDKKRIKEPLTSLEREKYLESSKGHPKYLQLICNQRNHSCDLDDSVISQKVSNIFLEGFSENQKQMIQVLACCRWFDRQLIEGAIQAVLAILDAKLTLYPDEDPSNEQHCKTFEWLMKQHFVEFEKDRYHLHSLVRQVLRRRLFQENRELFYQVHDCLAKYFKERADNLQRQKPQFTKYSDLEWCEYTGEYLYHACFSQQEDYQKAFIYHLFASIYLRQAAVINIAFKEIENEFSLENHPLLQSPTRNFLKKLAFVVKYNWVAFELTHETDFGKYSADIEDAVQLIKNQIHDLPDGIGTVAALEYIVKNFPLNASKVERSKWETRLREAIEHTADKIDPEFSSHLFMQSVCWQAVQADDALRWCEQALDYKSDNANAWFKKGKILQIQGNEYCSQQNNEYRNQQSREKAQSCYEEALRSYEKALKIQSYDHRYWQSKGEVLECLGELLKSQLLFYDTCDIHDENCKKASHGIQLQQAAYYQLAFDSYDKARQFRPNDGDLNKKCADIKKARDQALKDFALSNQANDEADKIQAASNFSHIERLSYGELIDKGDHIRCEELLEDRSVEENNQTLQLAFDCYTLAIRKQPEYPWGWYSRGLAYAQRAEYQPAYEQKRDHYRKAIQDYDKALALKADLTWALYNKGLALFKVAQQQQAGNSSLADYDQALANFDQAIQFDPEYEDAWYRRGLALTELQRYEEAIASYDKAIECAESRNDDQIQKVNQAGNSSNSPNGSITETAEPPNLRKGLRQAWYWYDRGNAYARLNAFEEAIASYQRAISANHKYYEAHNQLGVILRDKVQEYKKAADIFGEVIEIAAKKVNPAGYNASRWQEKQANAYCDRARAYREFSRDGLTAQAEETELAAIKDYQKALQLQPNHPEACQELFAILSTSSRTLEQYKSAIATFELVLDSFDEKAVQTAPDYHYNTLLALFHCCLKADETECLVKANKAYAKAKKLYPDLKSEDDLFFEKESDFKAVRDTLQQRLGIEQLQEL